MTRPGRTGGASLRESLAAAGFRPRKELGQNFLVDARALDAIATAAALEKSDVVLEIGPGPGVLTERLLGEDRTVIACEIDEDLLAFARDRIGDARVEWISGDAIDGRDRFGAALESALRLALNGERTDPTRGDAVRALPWKLVANLPYGISVPAVLLALAFEPAPELVVVTVQREVGDRFRAEPSTKDFGAVSVLARLLSDVEVVRKLGPGCFWPTPKVNSIVLRFRPRSDELRKLAAEKGFQQFVKACFSERRKQLAPLLHLRSERRLPAAAIADALRASRCDPATRADALPPEIFASLFRSLWRPAICGGPDAPSI